jgi:hypothetical protein
MLARFKIHVFTACLIKAAGQLGDLSGGNGFDLISLLICSLLTKALASDFPSCYSSVMHHLLG